MDEDGAQSDRFGGERAFLTRYPSLDALALDLYAPDGTRNDAVISGFSRVHHIRENIAFYLDPLLWKIDPRQIKGVMMQENLNADIKRVFGINIGERREKITRPP